jgi:hypothetical protein
MEGLLGSRLHFGASGTTHVIGRVHPSAWSNFYENTSWVFEGDISWRPVGRRVSLQNSRQQHRLNARLATLTLNSVPFSLGS